jgi:hypothetical protein
VHEITSKLLIPARFADVAHISGFEDIKSKYPGYLTGESKLTMGPMNDPERITAHCAAKTDIRKIKKNWPQSKPDLDGGLIIWLR